MSYKPSKWSKPITPTRWEKPVVVDTPAQMSDTQEAFKTHLLKMYPQLVTKINTNPTLLTVGEIACLKVKGDLNPLIVLGVCSKYKVAKRLANLANYMPTQWAKTPALGLDNVLELV